MSEIEVPPRSLPPGAGRRRPFPKAPTIFSAQAFAASASVRSTAVESRRAAGHAQPLEHLIEALPFRPARTRVAPASWNRRATVGPRPPAARKWRQSYLPASLPPGGEYRKIPRRGQAARRQGMEPTNGMT